MAAFRGGSVPRRPGLAAAAVMAGACSGPPGAGRTLGDDLGTFSVAATESENTCGPGALGSRERFAFEVDLSRAHSELFWNESVQGRVDGSLAFELRAEVRVQLRASTAAAPACAIRRSDEISGVLQERAAEGIVGFEGVMSYAFESEMPDGCAGGVLEQSGLPVVPCRLGYALSAERRRAPE